MKRTWQLGLSAILSFWVCATVSRADATNSVAVVEFSPSSGDDGSVFVWRSGIRIVATNMQSLFPGDFVATTNQAGCKVIYREPNKHLGKRTVVLAPGEQSVVPISAPDSSWWTQVRQGVVRLIGLGAATEDVTAGAGGTEYEVRVDSLGTVITLVEGVLSITNLHNATNFLRVETSLGALPERVIAERNGFALRGPFPTTDLVQWWHHYPAVLDWRELPPAITNEAGFRASLDAYRRGDLKGALTKLPRRANGEIEGGIYAVALRIANGEREAFRLLTPDLTDARLAGAVLTLIAALSGREFPADMDPNKAELASQWLALSWWWQSRHASNENLKRALEAARRAAEKDPTFALAHAKVAELEFSFGRISAAEQALKRALDIPPTNAAVLAMKGFLAASQNDLKGASNAFAAARAIDSRLPEAWLGLGLIAYRRPGFFGFRESDGLDELQRAVIEGSKFGLAREYLALGLAKTEAFKEAFHQLEVAKSLDPKSPSPWWYSALIRVGQNDLNRAVEDTQVALERNDNRRLYRARPLLEQDRAIRDVGLARVYQRSGLDEVALREAARALEADYASPSAHLFLAESFDLMRDPTRFNHRFETPWFHEFLLANILMPVGGGPLSPNMAQREYSRLFDPTGLALRSFSEARSDGQFREIASHTGVFGNSAYALDLNWQHNDGVRPNNQLDRYEAYAQIKQQFGPLDTALLLAKIEDFKANDNFQYYSPPENPPRADFRETQHPHLIAAWRHEWAPEFQTIALAGYLENDFRFDTDSEQLLTYNVRGPQSTFAGFNDPRTFKESFQSHWTVGLAELNQIAKCGDHMLVGGGRLQRGEFTANSMLTGLNQSIRINSSSETDFSRGSIYLYDQWRVSDDLSVTLGSTWDSVEYPANYRRAPVNDGTMADSRLLPKAGLVWSPHPKLTLRAAYAESLGGASQETDYTLEPVQLAGFTHMFRNTISESVVGPVEGNWMGITGAAVDIRPWDRAYLSFEFNHADSRVRRLTGALQQMVGPRRELIEVRPVSTAERLEYSERAFSVAFHQLLGEQWAIGIGGRYCETDLNDRLPELPFLDNSHVELHQAFARLVWNCTNGIFARLESRWYWQTAVNPQWGKTKDEFTQTDISAGWRFPRQKGELEIGLLNLADTDYHLDPLTAQPEFPHSRVFFVRLKVFLQ